eukprot:13235072-Heterocapsa_arctica.AAC.1
MQLQYFGAIELANGEGLLRDTSDVEHWRGVTDIDPNECRKLPVIWQEDTVTTFSSDPDGYASYGHHNWHGPRGVVPITIS